MMERWRTAGFDRAVAENDNICAIYNDIDEVEGEVTYDE